MSDPEAGAPAAKKKRRTDKDITFVFKAENEKISLKTHTTKAFSINEAWKESGVTGELLFTVKGHVELLDPKVELRKPTYSELRKLAGI